MHTRPRFVHRVVIALLVAALLLPQASAFAQDDTIYVPVVANGGQPQQLPDDSVEITASDVESAAALAYWTRERMAAATPYAPEVAVSAPVHGAEVEASAPSAMNIPGFSTGGLPAADADAIAQSEYAEEWALAAQADASAAGVSPAAADFAAGVYTFYLGNYYTQLWQYYPYRAYGKLYFNTPTGGGYCGASVITSTNTVVTAAHCLFNTDTNRWNSNFVFVPAERNGARPYGSFPWLGARVRSEWVAAPNYNAGIRFDVGLLRFGNNTSGRPVTYYTGWLGTTWNFSPVINLTEPGYPSNLSTLYTHILHSESANYSLEVIKYGANFGRGASGSPLIRSFSPYRSGAYNYVGGVQSGSNTVPTPSYNVAPRFTTANFRNLCTSPSVLC